MSFTSLLIHTVTLYNVVPGATDRYGNEVETFGSGTQSAARVQQLDVGGQQREQLGGGDVRATWFKIFLPPNVTVDGLSVITWGSRRLSVDGQPHLVHDSGASHHYEVNAKEVLGG